MREIPIGEYIREHRQKKNMTIAKLADGICDASTLSRLGRGVHFASRSKISLLLQRLDLPEDRIIALVSANDLEVRSLKRDIRAEVIRFERADPKDHPALREQILAKLKELEALADEDDLITKQYILSEEVTLGRPEGPYTPAQRQELLLQALRMTVPGFRLDRISQFRYGREEMTILNMIARTLASEGKKEEAIDLYDQLLRNIERNNRELDRFASQFCLIAHNYAISLGRAERYEDAIQLAERGQEIGVSYGNYQFLPGFLAIKAGCYFFLGEREKSASLYTQACHIYKAMGDEHNLKIIRQEGKDFLGLDISV